MAKGTAPPNTLENTIRVRSGAPLPRVVLENLDGAAGVTDGCAVCGVYLESWERRRWLLLVSDEGLSKVTADAGRLCEACYIQVSDELAELMGRRRAGS